MDTPMPPEDVVRVLEAMSFFQKRALKKAGFTWDGLHRLAGTEYGAGLAEAVLACHTDLLGREPRADEPDKAQAAHRHPGVAGPEKPAFDAPRYSRPTKDERAKLDELAEMAEQQKKAARDQQRRNPGGRRLP
ncbi:hypothetical protein ABIA35_001118 [Catenulispora sp. MAP12-49]|uniref:hypothetical protein n=1 Tax=Catenulispora sp. MAP12-49 TaxID=3156302 RepID=UPI003515ED21